MKITLPNSNKTLGAVKGTFVARCPLDADDAAGLTPTWFEEAIDKVTALQRLGPATIVRSEKFGEVRCDVEYGPVLGAHKSDLTRRLAVIARGFEHAVTGCARRDVRMNEITTTIAELEAQIDGIDLSLAYRERLSERLTRLRALVPAKEVRS